MPHANAAAAPAAAAAAPAAALARPRAETVDEAGLTDAQRDACLAALDRDGFCVLPLALPAGMVARANAYMDGYCADPRRCHAPQGAFDPARPTVGGAGLLTEMGSAGPRALNAILAPPATFHA
jgi:hypothetical protein